MDVIYSKKDIVNNIVITYMIVYGYWTYHGGDHFIMYPNVKSWCNTSETNIILYTNYISIRKNIHIEIWHFKAQSQSLREYQSTD